MRGSEHRNLYPVWNHLVKFLLRPYQDIVLNIWLLHYLLWENGQCPNVYGVDDHFWSLAEFFVFCELQSWDKWPKCGMKIVADWGGCSKWLSAVLALAHDRDGWVLLHLRHFCAYTQRELQQFHKIVIITFVLGLLTGLYKIRGMHNIQVYRCTLKRWATFGHCQNIVPKFSAAVKVWNGISKLGLTPFISVSGNISTIKYCEIVGEGLMLCNILINVLQQDNARLRTATHTCDWFTRNHLTVMECPVASSDLNPKESDWQIMKDRLEKKNIEKILQTGKLQSRKRGRVWIRTV